MWVSLRRILLRAFRTLGIGLGGGYLLTCLLLYFFQERLLFFPTALPSNFIYPFSERFSEVFLPVDGATLAALHFTQDNPKGVVLFFYGNADTLRAADLTARPFLQSGYDVLMLEYRGYGKSTGAIASEDQFLRDTQAAYDYLRRTYRDDQIVVYGRSMGTGPAVYLASVNAPRTLILEAPYFSLADLVAQKAPFLPLFLLRYPMHSDQRIGAVRCPVYLFHGTLDGLIPFESSERLSALISAPHQVIPVIGADHGSVPAFPVYEELLKQILR
jgi:alpha-beta hydrolase superfamily lysophospholipase